jgi:uncharacterized protein (DUF1501 family)
MLRFESNRDVRFCDGLSRRDFLIAGGLAAGAGLTQLAGVHAATPAAPRDTSCIQLFLVGGPSHIDTFDPKPDAPSGIRGPFGTIATAVPGLRFSELFPRMAKLADRIAVLRSVFHKEAPIHETGQQLLQTGGLSRLARERPHLGAAVSKLRGPAGDLPPWMIVPGPIANTGVSVSHGQEAGVLGASVAPVALADVADIVLRDPANPFGLDPARARHDRALLDAVDHAQRQLEAPGRAAADRYQPLFRSEAKQAFDLSRESPATRSRYGNHTFGQSCLLARRLVERGVRFVTVNMFDSVFNHVTWDCHANGGDLNSSLADYKTVLAPMLDEAYSALLTDLEERGLLAKTVVACMGEFGRTPKLNNRGGRDHWPNVWSALLAGGSIHGGQAIGASDAHGMEPKDRPIHATEVTATLYDALGIDGRHERLTDAEGRPIRLVDAEPVREAFGS